MRFRRTTVLAMCLTSLIGSGLQAQENRRNQRQPDAPKERVKISGKLKGLRGGVLHVVGEKGSQWLVKMPDDPRNVKFTATASVDWLQPGMFVRFTSNFDKKGVSQSNVKEILVFTPSESRRPGIVRADELGGDELFADAKEPAQKTEMASFVVAGQLSYLKKGRFKVRVSNQQQIQAELEDGATVGVDIADIRFARPGDDLMIDGWHFKGQRSHVYATQMSVNAATPLGSQPDKRNQKP